VAGANISNIIGIISMDFLKWITISLMISIPITWLIMKKWLDHFPYRIDLHWWLLLLGGMIAIVVALLTISVQSNRAARINPVTSLRYD